MTEEKPKPILVIAEDDPHLAPMLEDVFKKAGYDVRSYANGEEALEELKRIGKPVVLLTDYGLSDQGGKINGIELIQAAKSQGLGTQSIMLSGSGGVKDQATAEGVAFLSKPAENMDMKAAVAVAQRKIDGVSVPDAPDGGGGRSPIDHVNRGDPRQGSSFD